MMHHHHHRPHIPSPMIHHHSPPRIHHTPSPFRHHPTGKGPSSPEEFAVGLVLMVVVLAVVGVVVATQGSNSRSAPGWNHSFDSEWESARKEHERRVKEMDSRFERHPMSLPIQSFEPTDQAEDNRAQITAVPPSMVRIDPEPGGRLTMPLHAPAPGLPRRPAASSTTSPVSPTSPESTANRQSHHSSQEPAGHTRPTPVPAIQEPESRATGMDGSPPPTRPATRPPTTPPPPRPVRTPVRSMIRRR